MSPLPLPIIGFFVVTVAVGFYLFAVAVRGSRTAIALSLIWIVLQSVIALSGFYRKTSTIPPHLFLAAIPPLLLIATLFVSASGLRFIDGMSLKWAVLIHSVRLLVEATLYWLLLYKQVPALMSLEGGNVDILAGLSAPLIWWAFRRKYVGPRGLLIWNCLALLSVLNAMGRAMLSAPFRFQHFAFDQPTIAILVFPFVLLPAFLVPSVVFCHLAVLRKLFRSTASSK